MTKTITAYKAFDPDWKCRDFQFEVGKSYEHDEEVIPCESGFHACENPFDCWNHYDLTASKLATVTVGGTVEKHGPDSKIAAAKITIEAELSFAEIIRAGVSYVLNAANKKNKASGDDAKLAASGGFANLAASGGFANLAASGGNATLAASGYFAKLAASGGFANLAASGGNATLAASGGFANLAASGNSAKLAASGYSAKLAASGGFANLAASGGNATLAASGYFAKLAASGHSAKIKAEGENSVIASAGPGATAEGAAGTWISLAEFIDGKCVGFATGCIGQNGLKPGIRYRAKGGKLVEATQ